MIVLRLRKDWNQLTNVRDKDENIFEGVSNKELLLYVVFVMF